MSQSIPARELGLFYRRYATLLRHGSKHPSALNAVLLDTRHPQLRQVISALKDSIERGLPLHEAFGAQAETFGAVTVAAVKAGEQSGGHLHETLEHLARLTELEAKSQWNAGRDRQGVSSSSLVLLLAGYVTLLALSASHLLRRN